MNDFGKALVLAVVLGLTACGTTSDIRPTAPAGPVAGSGAQAATVDLSGYDRVAVLDFVDATDLNKLKPDKREQHKGDMARAVKEFPDLIAQQLRSGGAFAEVLRGPTTGKALVVSGRITQLEEGSASLRLWIGMGAGNSYFDAVTELSDSESARPLGEVSTAKNSWALGGIIASSQTVESFMQGAAKAIGDKIKADKVGHQATAAK